MGEALGVAQPWVVWLVVVPGPGGSPWASRRARGAARGPNSSVNGAQWFAENQNAPLTELNGSFGAHANP
jgi:hypothetical protein